MNSPPPAPPRPSLALPWLFLLSLGALASLFWVHFNAAKLDEVEILPPAELIEPVPPQAVLTLGDIDPQAPIQRVKNLEPLALYLQDALEGSEVRQVKIRIARDLQEMIQFLNEGKVDLVIDSVYPSLVIHRHAKTSILLRNSIRGKALYWSVFIGLKTREKGGLESLAHHRLALEGGSSTSGHLLPLSHLQQEGFRLQALLSPESAIEKGAVGYFTTGGFLSTVEMVRSGQADFGALSINDFQSLPAELQSNFQVIAETMKVPRQLICVRTGLDPVTIDNIRGALLALDDQSIEPFRNPKERVQWTWKFDTISLDELQLLLKIEQEIHLLMKDPAG